LCFEGQRTREIAGSYDQLRAGGGMQYRVIHGAEY
jgi:hypothetical protein